MTEDTYIPVEDVKAGMTFKTWNGTYTASSDAVQLGKCHVAIDVFPKGVLRIHVKDAVLLV